MGSQSSKSGLGFSGWAPNGANEVTPLTVAGKQNVTDTSGTPFTLGVVTHYNLPISAGTAATLGSFKLTLFSIAVDGTAVAGDLSWTFPLTLDETPNSAASYKFGSGLGTLSGTTRGCPYTTYETVSRTYVAGYLNDSTGQEISTTSIGCLLTTCACSDRIYFNATTAASSTGSITLAGRRYGIDIVGFSDLATYSASNTSSTFISQEAGSTVKFLFGRMSIQCNCPGVQVTTSNEACNCACPTSAAARSQDDCPADYLFNSTSCSCVYQNNNCAAQRAALSPALDVSCESGVCAPNSAGIYVLSVAIRNNNTGCNDTARNNLCSFRCITGAVLGGFTRSTCQQRPVACSTTVACRTSACVPLTGICAETSVTSGLCSITNPLSCNNYACNAQGNCTATPIACPGNQVAQGLLCACSCPAASLAICVPGQFYNTTSCRCEETAPCSVAIAGLVGLDLTCESLLCNVVTGVNTLVLNVLGQPTCGGGDRCQARCQGYTDLLGLRQRATCNQTAVLCGQPAQACRVASCNSANGNCDISLAAAGSTCTPSTPVACSTSACAANGTCISTPFACPGSQVAQGALCLCSCPTAPAICPLGQLWNAVSCRCEDTGPCSQPIARALTSSPLDLLCETYSCLANNTLSWAVRNDISACGITTDLCATRCRRYNITDTLTGQTITRGACNVTAVSCPSAGICKLAKCATETGACATTNLASGTLCVPTTPTACTTYACDGSSNGPAACIGTPFPCPGGQKPIASSNCVCACNNVTACGAGLVWDTLACQCKPSAPCSVALANLLAPLDLSCELVSCNPDQITLNLTVTNDYGACANVADRCTSRCQQYQGALVVGGLALTRSRCNKTAVVCADPGVCRTATCNPSSGTCSTTNNTAGTTCTPTTPPAACTTYTCNGAGGCIGTLNACQYPAQRPNTTAGANCACSCPTVTTCLNGSTWNPINCTCQNDYPCSSELISQNYDAACETYTCTANVLISINPREMTDGAYCTGSTDKCAARCTAYGLGRSRCNRTAVTCSQPQACQAISCSASTGGCTTSSLAVNTTCTPATAPEACKTYACDGSAGGNGACKGTILPCPGAQVPNITAGANCRCSCATVTACDPGMVWNSLTCTCDQTGPCSRNLALLQGNSSVDPTCERYTCAADNTTLTLIANGTGAACSSSSNLCVSRCQTYTASGQSTVTRSRCDQTPVTCAAAAVCQNVQCAPGSGSCVTTNIAAATACTPTTAPEACKTYACDGSGSCAGTILPCPTPQQPNTTAGANCRCSCPTVTACDPGMVWNSVNCTCDQTGPCSRAIALLQGNATIDPGCESYSCAADNVTLTFTANATNAPCGSASGRCAARCMQSTVGGVQRSRCNQTAVSCPAPAVCKATACNEDNAACDTTDLSSGTACTPTAAAEPCTNYACDGSGNCVGTPFSCPSPQQANTTAGANCQCSCPTVTACTAGLQWNAINCTCDPTGPCSVALATLATPIDPSCETATCGADNVTLTFTPNANGSACSTSSNLCSSRCIQRTEAGATRAACDQTTIQCGADPTCQTLKCDAATGQCVASNQTAGTPCEPSGAREVCHAYLCSGSECLTSDPCPGPTEPNPAAGADCKCDCFYANGTQMQPSDCPLDYQFVAAECACKPTGQCVQQLAALPIHLDPLCEDFDCSDESVLTIFSRTDDAFCGADESRCDRRCKPNPTDAQRSYCYVQPVQCAEAVGCKAFTCNDTSGGCDETTLPEGASCNPENPEPCYDYKCSATGECVRSFLCGRDLVNDDSNCRLYSCSNATLQCFMTPIDGTNCSSSPCASESRCFDGHCRAYTFDCASQEAVDAGVTNATTGGESCQVRVCKVDPDSGKAVCVIDYYLDPGVACPNEACQVNSVCDGNGLCIGDPDPKCDKQKESHRTEIIGSAAAGGILSLTGIGAFCCAAAGAAGLIFGIRRRRLLNFESWAPESLTSAAVSPLYVPTAVEHVNPLADL